MEEHEAALYESSKTISIYIRDSAGQGLINLELDRDPTMRFPKMKIDRTVYEDRIFRGGLCASEDCEFSFLGSFHIPADEARNLVKSARKYVSGELKSDIIIQRDRVRKAIKRIYLENELMR